MRIQSFLKELIQRSNQETQKGLPPKDLRGRIRWEGLSDYPRHFYDDEDAAREALKVVDAYTMASYERMITLWQQIRYLDRVHLPGCLVECGTWRGGAIGMMALAYMAGGKPWRPIHLFDSFEGLPEPVAEKDGERAVKYAAGRASGALKTIGQCIGALDDCKRLLHDVVRYPTELIYYHAGWFQETVPAAASEVRPIALLRLDGDWYESTKICLETLFPRTSSGGIVVVDDYGRWPGCRQAVDEFLSRLDRPPFLHHIDATGRYLIVP